MYEPYENEESQEPQVIQETEEIPAQTPPKADPPQWDSFYHYTPPKQKKSGWTGGKVIAIALVCSLLSGLLGAGGMFLAGRLTDTQDSGTGTSETGKNNTQNDMLTMKTAMANWLIWLLIMQLFITLWPQSMRIFMAKKCLRMQRLSKFLLIRMCWLPSMFSMKTLMSC